MKPTAYTLMMYRLAKHNEAERAKNAAALRAHLIGRLYIAIIVAASLFGTGLALVLAHFVIVHFRQP